MGEPKDMNGGRCPARCPHCGQLLAAQEGAPAGGRMALLAAVAFLNPVVMAILGIIVVPMAWPSPAAQVCGGLAGLAIGIVESSILVKLIHGAWKSRKE